MAYPLVTFADEYGFAYTVAVTPTPERRRNARGPVGPRPRDEESYDQRQIRPREAVTDVSGYPLDGP